MIACVGIGTFTGFIFLMVLLLVAGPVEDVIESPAGPLLHIFFHATNSRTGSIMLLLSVVSEEIAIWTTHEVIDSHSSVSSSPPLPS